MKIRLAAMTALLAVAVATSGVADVDPEELMYFPLRVHGNVTEQRAKEVVDKTNAVFAAIWPPVFARLYFAGIFPERKGCYEGLRHLDGINLVLVPAPSFLGSQNGRTRGNDLPLDQEAVFCIDMDLAVFEHKEGQEAETTVAHEFGHSMGLLDHIPNTLMSEGFTRPIALEGWQVSTMNEAAQQAMEQTTAGTANEIFVGGMVVSGTWRSKNASGIANGISLTVDTGYLWFFNKENVEVVIKVLEGCSLNDHRWVFLFGGTNVEVEILVYDPKTGNVKKYKNALEKVFMPVQETTAFRCWDN